MALELKPYPAYKDSGIAWIDDVPAHWNVIRNRYLMREVDQRSVRGEETLLSVSQYTGVRPRVESVGEEGPLSRASSLEGYKLVAVGDLVINIMLAWNGSLGFSGHDGLVSPAYGVYKVTNDAIPRYLHYLLKTPAYLANIKAASTGVVESRLRLYSDSLYDLRSLVPPLDEQRAIADFLDGMDARITRFIAARRKMIALLEEKKQAVINHAVTRGLDPSVPMKASGVDWLGEIPAHWSTTRIRNSIIDSIAGIWGEEPTDTNLEDHVWCIRVADFHMPTLRVSEAKKTIRAVPRDARLPRLLAPGDILLEKSGGGENQPVGRAVKFDWDEPAVTSNFVTRLRPESRIVRPDFLLNCLEALQSSRITQLSIKQTTGIQNLDERHYLSNSIPLPDLNEQGAIIDHIDRETSRIDALITHHRREIELIQEYRTRLISDVVTGKLDVRGVELPAVEEIIGEEIEAAMEDEAVSAGELEELEA